MTRHTTRSRVIAGALDAIRRKGYAEASVEEMSEVVGLTKGGLYSGFGSKRGVLLALIEAWAQESIRQLERRSREPFAAVADLVTSAGVWRDIVPEFWRQALDDATVKAALDHAYESLSQALAAALRRWRYPEDAAAGARTALLLYDGLTAMAAIHDPRVRGLRRADVSRLLMAVEAEPAPRPARRPASTA